MQHLATDEHDHDRISASVGAMTEMKWPRKGDRAFPPALPPLEPDILAAFVCRSSGAYTAGFKQAADMVVEGARRDLRNPDVLFAPLAYLYRHYLELELKDIACLGMELGMIKVTDGRLEEHNLHKLWNSCREVIERVWPEGDRTDLNAVEQVILEFHRFDPSGQGFRYYKDLDGNPHLMSVPDWVSLEPLKSTMDGVANFLEAAAAGIDACDPGPP